VANSGAGKTPAQLLAEAAARAAQVRQAAVEAGATSYGSPFIPPPPPTPTQ
jgi:hypothetical protein